MTIVRLFIITLSIVLAWSFGAPLLFGQTVTSNSGSEPTPVTASVSDQHVRFAAFGLVARLQLEVYSDIGQRIFDTDLRGGNVLDWMVHDGSGNRLSEGAYI